MNQLSKIGFGSDPTVYAGYAQAAGDRLGNFDLVIENTGSNTLTLQMKEYVASSNTWNNVGSSTTIVAGGTSTLSFCLFSKILGFFGTGNTTANISTVIRNKSNLRGAQIDICASGRKGWGFDSGFDKNAFRTPWPQDWATNSSNAGPGTTV
jgi:hypothetical protein